MMVRLFVTSKRRLNIVIDKSPNGLYTAYENHTRGDGGNIFILNSRSLDWLIDTLRMRYSPDETLIQIV